MGFMTDIMGQPPIDSEKERRRRAALTGLNTAAHGVTQQYLQQNKPSGAAALGFSPDVAQFLGFGLGDMEQQIPDPVRLSQKTRSGQANRKAGAEGAGFDPKALLEKFRAPAGESSAVGAMAPGLRMKGDGKHWSGGPAVEMTEQESAAFEQARQSLKMQALGLRGAVDMKKGEAQDALAAQKTLGAQIRDLERRKSQMAKALGASARAVEGSRQGAKRWSGWIDSQKGRIDSQIAALRAQMREGKVRAMTLAEVAKATQTDLKGLELGMDRAALSAVFDLRAAGQEQAFAQQSAMEQENYARQQDQADWQAQQEQAQFEREQSRRTQQGEAQTKRQTALEKAIGLIDTEMADKAQKRDKASTEGLQQRRSALQESLLRALEEAGAQGDGSEPITQWTTWEELTPEQQKQAKDRGITREVWAQKMQEEKRKRGL